MKLFFNFKFYYEKAWGKNFMNTDDFLLIFFISNNEQLNVIEFYFQSCNYDLIEMLCEPKLNFDNPENRFGFVWKLLVCSF